MKLALALISALILMDYAAAVPRKHLSSYVPNKASLEPRYEQVEELEDYLEEQIIWSDPHNDHGPLQQSKRRRVYYPAAVGDKGYSVYNLYVDPQMTTGAVEVVFKSPTSGINSMTFYNDKRDTLLFVYIMFTSQRIRLNSKPRNGDYGEWVYPEGFPFLCCGYVTILTLRVDITPKAFIISVNGLEIESYPFRPELGPPVDRIMFHAYDTDAEFISMAVEY